MTNIVVTAKTYDEAITKAMTELQTTSDHMIVEIVEKGTSGLFGMIGGRPWTIKAKVKSEEEEQKEAEEKAKAEAAAKKAAAEKAAAEKAAAAKAAAEKAAAEKAAAAKAAAEKAAAEKAAAKKAAEAAMQKKQEAETAAPEAENKNAAADDEPGEGRRQRSGQRGRRDGAPRRNDFRKDAESREKREEHVGREVPQEEADEIKAKAAEFLNQIFGIMEEKIDIDTDFNYQDNELSISLSGDDMGVMIGKRGQTLDSLQYLVSLVVNKHRDVYIRVKLDTENYRERREQKLRSLARNIAHKVKQTRKPVSLEPMNPYERRIIHSALQRDSYVTTYSEGEDPYRHIVVCLKKDAKARPRDTRE